MNEQITRYISQAHDQQREVMEVVRKMIHDNVSPVQEEFKWSRPVFKSNNDFAYFKTAKAYVTIGFFHFQKLHDPDNLLEGTGKEMRHIKIKNTAEINRELLKEWFKTLTT